MISVYVEEGMIKRDRQRERENDVGGNGERVCVKINACVYVGERKTN